jgi:hypothetical protein
MQIAAPISWTNDNEQEQFERNRESSVRCIPLVTRVATEHLDARNQRLSSSDGVVASSFEREIAGSAFPDCLLLMIAMVIGHVRTSGYKLNVPFTRSALRIARKDL